MISQTDIQPQAKFIENSHGQKLAYIAHEGIKDAPSVVFCGGFKSDMRGSKAQFLENLCQEQDLSYVRFDYTGHGESDGAFEEGSIGSWRDDARDVLEHICPKDREIILVGSSMGGWISLLLARELPKRITGLVLIAPAPDFTSEIWERLSAEQQALVTKNGIVDLPNDYSDEPYRLSKILFDDGKNHHMLHDEIAISCPVSILQGKLDKDVPWEKACRIQEALKTESCDVILIKDGGHSLSRPEDLKILGDTVLRHAQKL